MDISRMKTVLITGGAGFIGSSLADELIKSNKIVVIDNMNNYYSPKIKENNISNILKNKNYTFYKGDILDIELLDKIFNEHKIDTVVHLAARAGVRPSIEEPALYMKVNVEGTTNILECCRKYNIKKVAVASSSSVYGALKEGPFSEDMDTTNTISPYATSKMATELLCKTYTNLYDMQIIALRFFTVYGPRQRPDLAINKFISLMEKDNKIPVYGDGTTKRNYTYIDDIIKGIMLSLEYEDKKFEVFNLGGDQTITLNDLIAKIEKALGKKAQIDYLPMQVGDVPLTHADLSKVKRILGYEPQTSIEEGLENFLKWKHSSLNE